MAQPGDGAYILQHGETDPIKLAREALNEALIKQENDRTLWTPEWQHWANDARTALAALDAIPQPAPVICERCAAIRSQALSDMAATDAAHGLLDAPAPEKQCLADQIRADMAEHHVPAPLPGDAELGLTIRHGRTNEPYAEGWSLCMADESVTFKAGASMSIYTIERGFAAYSAALRTRLAEVEGAMEHDVGILIANIRYLEECLGEPLDTEDAAVVAQIEAAHRKLKEGK